MVILRRKNWVVSVSALFADAFDGQVKLRIYVNGSYDYTQYHYDIDINLKEEFHNNIEDVKAVVFKTTFNYLNSELITIEELVDVLKNFSFVDGINYQQIFEDED